jgi:hypothetical protein
LSIYSFDAVEGLVGFAAFVALLVWLILVMQSYEITYVTGKPIMSQVIKYGSVAAAFFSMLGFSVFAGSGFKDEFCKRFDPDAAYNNTYCGYNDGFYAVVAAFVIGVVQVWTVYKWMPEDVGSAKYEFASATPAFASAGGFTSTTATSGIASFQSQDATFTGSSGFGSSTYKDVA